jgi:hypothetical protein
LPAPGEADPRDWFKEILFERHIEGRPQISFFVKKKRPKSLVVVDEADLFYPENAFVDQFLHDAVKSYIPIICLNDEEYPLSAASIRAAGEQLPFMLMDNQNSVETRIKKRLAALRPTGGLKNPAANLHIAP